MSELNLVKKGEKNSQNLVPIKTLISFGMGSLGNNIIGLRKKEKISQEKLGERVGVTRQTVSNWELDQTVPDANQLLALSKALNTSIDLLVGNDIQNLLEQKVGNVETEIIKNNKFQKIIISVLSIIVVLFILAFILLA